MGKKLMNASLIVGAFTIALALGSCKEKGVVVDLGNGIKAVDTTFTAAVETPQDRVVLMEECTGVSCPPCPKAHVILASLKTQYADRLAVIGIQVFGISQGYPVVEAGDTITKHDNRTQKGTDLATGIFSKLNSLPGAGIDRKIPNPSDNSLYVIKDFWTTGVATRMAVPTTANVSIINKSYNATTKQLTLTVHVAYTGATTKRQKLNVALIEDKVIDAQEKDLLIIEDYEHEHVLRDLLTDPNGSAMLNGVAIAPGRVYERNFTYDLSGKSLWNVDNMSIVAYVSNAEVGDVEVQQAAATKVK